MSTQITGNEPLNAFAIPGHIYSDGSSEPPATEKGITIRQHFASMAMQALLSQHVKFAKKEDIDEYTMEPVYKGRFLYSNAEDDYEYMARDACKAADAVIKELNKPTNNETR